MAEQPQRQKDDRAFLGVWQSMTALADALPKGHTMFAEQACELILEQVRGEAQLNARARAALEELWQKQVL